MSGQKNILLLVADDLGKMLGCYGNKKISTPHIDKFAAEGTLFDYAFASTASCSGSRSTIYTGLHTHQNGQYGLANGRHHFTTFDHVETAPRVFNDLGYLTGVIGKIHVGPASVYPWTVREESTSRNVAYVAERAEDFFQEAKKGNQPFFLTIGYIDPHRDRTRSGWGNDDPTGDVDQGHYGPNDVDIPYFMQDLPEVRVELAQYYRSIHRLDQGVGMIRDALARTGLANDPLVIFVSDNGAPFVNSKTTLFDAGVQLPLIIHNPAAKQGIRNTNMVSFTDLLPTMLDFAGHADRPSNPPRQGRSLLPILDTESRQPGWDRVFGSHTFHESMNYWPTRYLRTPRYKYHRNIAHQLDFPFAEDLYSSVSWEAIRKSGGKSLMLGRRPFKKYLQRPPEELFDLEADPEEVDDLAGRPEYKGLVKELREAMEAWQVRTLDPWLYRDGISVVALRHHFSEGLEVPDRWDMDGDDPAGEDVPLYVKPWEGSFSH